jgi:hypothetical protein
MLGWVLSLDMNSKCYDARVEDVIEQDIKIKNPTSVP